jgi:predicted site-specific integrase-resolvase
MPEKQTPPVFLTTERAAELLGSHSKTLMRWRAKGRGPRYVKLCGRVRYTPEAIAAFVAASEVDPAAAAITRNKRTRRRQRGSR